MDLQEGRMVATIKKHIASAGQKLTSGIFLSNRDLAGHRI